MLHLAHSPGPPLSEFVECFWLLSGAQTPRKERILPSGTIELVINLREDEMRIHDPARPERYKRFSGAILSGTYSKVFICDAMQHESIMGVHFKPGGAFPFLGVAANELADAHTDLADLWGRSALELRVRLCEVTTPRARFRIMEKFLTERLHHRAVKCHPALPKALNMFGQAGTAATVRDIAREIAYASVASSSCSKLRLASRRSSSAGYCDFSGHGRCRPTSRHLILMAHNGCARTVGSIGQS